jgi:hypothetical protein
MYVYSIGQIINFERTAKNLWRVGAVMQHELIISLLLDFFSNFDWRE